MMYMQIAPKPKSRLVYFPCSRATGEHWSRPDSVTHKHKYTHMLWYNTIKCRLHTCTLASLRRRSATIKAIWPARIRFIPLAHVHSTTQVRYLQIRRCTFYIAILFAHGLIQSSVLTSFMYKNTYQYTKWNMSIQMLHQFISPVVLHSPILACVLRGTSCFSVSVCICVERVSHFTNIFRGVRSKRILTKLSWHCVQCVFFLFVLAAARVLSACCLTSIHATDKPASKRTRNASNTHTHTNSTGKAPTSSLQLFPSSRNNKHQYHVWWVIEFLQVWWYFVCDT